MADKKGVIGIVYDKSTMFYLILHKNVPDKKGWEFLKAVVPEDDTEASMRKVVDSVLGLKKYKIVKKLDFSYPVASGDDSINNDIFLIETSMNTPVRMPYSPEKLNTYLWAKESTVLDKLGPDHKKILEKAGPDIPKTE